MPQVSKKSGMMNTMKTKPAKYALGTDAAVVEDPKKKPLVPVDNSTVSSSDPDSPKFIGPPTEAKMKLKTEDVALDKVATETKITSKANVPATTHSLAQIADMDKVKAHQEKLNKYGANLKVDGMWGAKTEKASRDLYPQYKEKPVASKTRQAPVSDSRMKGLFASSGKEDTTSTTAKTVSKATPKQVAKVDTTASNPAIPVTGSGAPVVSKPKNNSTYDSLDIAETKLKDGSFIKKDKQGNQYYTNGRVMGANGKMSNVDKNTRVVSNSNVDLNEIKDGMFSMGDSRKEIKSSKTSPYSIRENGDAYDRKTGKQIGKVDKKTGNIQREYNKHQEAIDQSNDLGNTEEGNGEGQLLSSVNMAVNTTKQDSGANIKDRTANYTNSKTETVAEYEEKKANQKEQESKGLDKTDIAIYGAEGIVPALARGIKNPIMRGLISASPTVADIFKTASDDKAESVGDYAKSATKATLRGATLGTIGSTIAGAGRRSVKGLIAEGKEATAIKSMRKSASKALNKVEASRSFGSVKDQNASLKAIDAAKAELQVAKSMKLSKQKSFGQNLGKAFDNTIVGKGIKTVTNSKIVKAVKSRSAVNSLKENDKSKTGKPLKGKSLDIAEETRINKLKADKDAIKQTAEDARYNNAVHNRPSDSSAKIKTTSNSSTNQLDDILGKNSEARAAAAPARAQAKFAAKSGEIVYDEGASSPNPNYKSGKAIREVNALRKAKLEEISKPMRLLGMGEAKTTSTKVEPSGSMKLNSTAKENPVKGKSNNSAARRGTKSKR